MNETNTVSPLRQRMIEDMAARKLNDLAVVLYCLNKDRSMACHRPVPGIVWMEVIAGIVER